MQQPDQTPHPNTFAGKMWTSLPEFFASASEALGGPSREPLLQLGIYLRDDKTLTNLEELMTYTAEQFEQCCLDVGGKIVWRSAVERWLGKLFRVMETAGSSSNEQYPKPKKVNSSFAAPDALCLGAYLVQTGKLEECIVPEGVLRLITSPKPLEIGITDKEATAIMCELYLWTMCTYGRINVDK